MIHAEIKIADEIYVINFPDENDIKKVYEKVNIMLASTDPTEVNGQLIQFFNIDKLKHIKVYTVRSSPAVEAPKTPEKRPNIFGPQTFESHTIFMGQKLRLYGVRYVDKTVNYYLILSINGQPALDTMNYDNLFKLTEYYAASDTNDGKDKMFICAVPEGAILDVQEAIEYITDLIETLEKETDRNREVQGKNAVAYADWSKKE